MAIAETADSVLSSSGPMRERYNRTSGWSGFNEVLGWGFFTSLSWVVTALEWVLAGIVTLGWVEIIGVGLCAGVIAR